MAVRSVSVIGVRSGRGSRCGLMECAQAVLWLERLGTSVLVGCGICLISHR